MVIIVDAKCVMNDDDDGDGDDNYNDDVIEFDAKCQNAITGTYA